MDAEVTLYFRDQLRSARATALRDSEAFDEIIYVLERLGEYLSDEKGLFHKGKTIVDLATSSPLAVDLPSDWSSMHTPFKRLYQLVVDARNTAMHEGASARYLTAHAIERSLILEDSLMMDCHTIGEYMVRNPVCAFLWQPLSFVRQTILINSFSYLPILKNADSEIVGLISDLELARYLRTDPGGNLSKGKLRKTLGETLTEDIECCPPKIYTAETPISKVLESWNGGDGQPILVQCSKSERLVGILTPFDLL